MMSFFKLISLILLYIFTFYFPNNLMAFEKCDFNITKKEFNKMRKGSIYNSVNTNGVACLKNYDGRNIYLPIKNGKINGLVKLYYYDDIIEETTPYKDSKKQGIEKRYFSSGAILRETPYKNDKIEGIEKIYYEIGGVESEIPYINNKIEGIRKDYYIDGALNSKISYKNDYKEGIAKKYYSDGTLKITRVYNKGKKHGVEKEYTKSSILFMVSPFKDGSVDGILKIFYEDTGKPMLFVDYINGIKHGKAVKYNTNGSIYAIINFENDYAVSGKCSNGYKLTSKDLETIQFSIYSIKCSK